MTCDFRVNCHFKSFRVCLWLCNNVTICITYKRTNCRITYRQSSGCLAVRVSCYTARSSPERTEPRHRSSSANHTQYLPLSDFKKHALNANVNHKRVIDHFQHVAGRRLHGPPVGIVNIHNLLLDWGQVCTDACEDEIFLDNAY